MGSGWGVAARPNARFLEDVGTVPARSEPAEGHNQRVIEAIAGRDILCAVVVVVVVWGRWRGADSEQGVTQFVFCWPTEVPTSLRPFQLTERKCSTLSNVAVLSPNR